MQRHPTFPRVLQQLARIVNVCLEPTMIAAVQQHNLLQHALLGSIAFSCTVSNTISACHFETQQDMCSSWRHG